MKRHIAGNGASSGPAETGQASHDPLTGLAGHELLVEYAFKALSRATRQGWVTGFFVIDIDDFSGITRAFGRDAGDQVLVELAARLLKALRGSDEVARPREADEGRVDGLGRFGPDRFIVVCENIVDDDVATSVAARIARLAAEPVLHGGREITFTLGIGVGISGPAGPGVGQRILEAEAALRTAKQRGQAQCEVLS